MDGNGSLKLPKGWSLATLGEIGSTTSGGTPSRKIAQYFEGNIPWLKSGELENMTITSTQERISDEGLNSSSSKIIPKGTLLIALYGATVGRLGILGIDAAINQAICAITVPEEIDARYLFWFLTHHRPTLLNMRQGGAQPNISQQVVRDVEFPLPPLPEQHRIVAKIEQLFSDLDAGVAALEQTKQQLKRYRQSVLQAAVTGKLTAEWRAAHQHELEPASVLLERIRAERAAKQNGKQKELPPLDTSELGGLPEGWAWENLASLAADEPNSITDGPFGSNLKTEHYTDAGPRVIRLQNIGDGFFVDAKAHIGESRFEKLRRHRVLGGDLVIAGLGEELPRACIIPEWVGNAIVKADCIRFKPNNSLTTSKYLNIALNSDPLRKFAAEIIHGVGRPRLNQQQIKLLPIPLPSVTEQDEIAKEVERRLSVTDQIEKTVDASLLQAERLRQSILKRAFAGKLVTQNPTDEPAEKLLERIRVSRENQANGKPKQMPLLNGTPKRTRRRKQ